MKSKTPPAEVVVQVGDEQIGFTLRDVPGGEVLHHLVHDGHEVASKNEFVGADFDVSRRGLQRRPPGVINHRVVAQQRQGGHVAARRKTRRDGVDKPLPAIGRNPIHVGLVGGFERGAAIQGYHRLVRCAVG